MTDENWYKNDKETCEWQVDSKQGIGKSGCTKQIFPLGDVEEIDYCLKCGKPVANVENDTHIVINAIQPID